MKLRVRKGSPQRRPDADRLVGGHQPARRIEARRASTREEQQSRIDPGVIGPGHPRAPAPEAFARRYRPGVVIRDHRPGSLPGTPPSPSAEACA